MGYVKSEFEQSHGGSVARMAGDLLQGARSSRSQSTGDRSCAMLPCLNGAVRWYLRYALSYRDVEELLRERGVWVDHTTVFRWVQRYAPELEKRCRPLLKATNDSYRVDETYILTFPHSIAFRGNVLSPSRLS